MAESKQESKMERKEDPKIDSKQETEVLIRILGYDIQGNKNIYTGLTKIKGISWTISNAICKKLNLKRSKKISEFSKPEIEKLESFIKELPIPEFLKNRRFDPETGETKHFYGSDLDMKKEFDIKRLRKMRSYKGVRHALKLPVRGQRTRANFRKRANKQAVGIKRKR